MSEKTDGTQRGPSRQAGFEVLVTAQEAYPKLEALFLDAQHRVDMGFRLFDPRTRLLSRRAREVGETWADLFQHTLNRGVPIDLTLSDFDPVMAFDLHSQAWHFVAQTTALNELTHRGAAPITVRCILHPARGGIVPRIMFAIKTRQALSKTIARLNDDPNGLDRLRFAPGLHDLIRVREGRIKMRPTALPRLHPVSLHHKMAIFDRSATYIGGLDLNERRVDDAGHDLPAQDTWHDTQLVSTDPALARDACTFLTRLPDVIDRKGQPPETSSAFRMTLSRRRARTSFRLAPENVKDTLLQEHLKQIAAARELIYLETQYFRDRRIVAALVAAGKRKPDLRVIALVPAAPEEVAFTDEVSLDARFGEHLQARGLGHIRKQFGDRFLVVSPVQPRRPDKRDTRAARATLAGAPIVYVHSKVSIFDDHAAIVSSANLNGRSMKWDAEAGVVVTEGAQVHALSDKVSFHWLGEAPESGLAARFEQWKQRALSNEALPPEARKGFIVPHALEPSRSIGTALPGAPEEMV